MSEVRHCYIHIPFCNSICSYCDFCKQYYHKKKVDKYLKDLEKEINNNYKKEALETIYIGGGTPTCLNIEELEKLLLITDKLIKEKDCEFTIEGNIESITKEKLLLFKKHNINRISIGIESINKNNLKFLERNINKEEVIEKIKLIKQLGFNNINVDLIYALPNETIEVLEEDLEFITSLDVEHISTYSLIIEDHTILGINHTKPIDEEIDREMYFTIINYLKEKEYNHYEVSNFSKKGYESKHNLCYWLNEEYYGFGCGAASYINNVRKVNTKSLTNYIKGNLLEKEELSLDDKIEYELLLNLRLKQGIDLERFKRKYNIELKSLYNYQELVKQNLLVEENNHLYIKEELFYVMNEIIVKLLDEKRK